MKKKRISENLLYPLIVGIILIIIPIVIPNIGSFFKKVFLSVFTFFGTTLEIKWWVFILLLLVALLFISGIIFFLLLFSKKPELDWSDYKQDVIEGVLWKWDYDGNALDCDSFAAFCPNCKIRLLYSYEHFDSKYYCDRCNKYCYVKRGGKDIILRDLYREIERRIHTEEWKKTMTK